MRKRIKIKTRYYRVHLVDDLREDGEALYGQVNLTDRVISLCHQQTPQQLIHSTIHEVTHSLLHEHGLSRGMSEAKEEAFVLDLEKTLARMFTMRWRD